MAATSMKSNGALVSIIGSANAACISHYFGVPILVFCHTYKFSNSCQIDSICNNIFGSPDLMVKS